MAALAKWADYSQARDDLFRHTDSEQAPWTVVRANDKRRARLNIMRHVLASIDYSEKDKDVVGEPDAKLVGSGESFFASG